MTIIEKIKFTFIAIPTILSRYSIRTNNIILFGAWFGKKYADNSKALYLYCLRNMSEKKIIWVTKSKEVYEELKKSKLPVVMYNSLLGIFFQLHAGVVVYCTGTNDLLSRLLGGATHINLWHGVGGGKKIGFDSGLYDSEYMLKNKMLQDYAFKNTYYLATSEEMKKVFSSAFHVPGEHFIYAGQPRNDFFYDDKYKPMSFSEELFQGKKIILYVPTHRKQGLEKIDCSKLFDFESLDKICEKYDCLLVIKKHFYHINEKENVDQFRHIIDITFDLSIDTNELLKRANYLISDYSSITADYLLLNRPILYYCYDLQRYLAEDRDVYWEYDNITPGPKVHNYTEFEEALVNIISGKDGYAQERKKVLDMFYNPDNQCPAAPKIIDQLEAILNEKLQ